MLASVTGRSETNLDSGGNMRALWRLIAIAVALVLIAAACSSEETGTSPDTSASEAGETEPTDAPDPEPVEEPEPAEEPESGAKPLIKIGSVNSLTGPVPFPEASAAAAAVFERYNNNPDGTFTVEYIAEDDAADPAIAAQAARKLVTADGVAILSGSASLPDCDVNGAYYIENGLYSIQGTGVTEACFTSSNIAPINTGPFAGLTASLYFTSEVLGHDSICYFQFDVGTPPDPRDAAVARWTEITGKSLTLEDLYAPGDDFTPFVTRAVEEGCTAVFEGGLDFTAIAFDAAAAAQGATFDIVHFTSAYTDDVAAAIGTPAGNTYANSEFEPFTELDSPALADWLELMNSAGVPLTSFAEGGYLAALATIQVIESAGVVDGDDLDAQREKIGAAVLAMEPFENDMLGSPYIFGDAPAHSPNQASKFVQLVDGGWVSVTDEFIVLTDFE